MATTTNNTTTLKHVYGNVLKLAIPLTLRTITLENGEAVATDTDYIPSSDHAVSVEFSKGPLKYEVKATMRDGNVAVVEDKGTIPVGCYAITVCCTDDNGDPRRFKQKCVLHVYDLTAEAGIEAGIEFEGTEWYLDAAIFLAVKGEDGADGADGNGIAYITTNETSVSGAYNTITFHLTDGTSVDFRVRNGASTEQILPEGVVTDTEYVHTDNNYTDEDKANVQKIMPVYNNAFGRVDYDSETKRINFYSIDDTLMETLLGYIDAAPFVLDGMLSRVEKLDDNLVFIFNTDSGKAPIYIPISSIFNAASYYTKSQVNVLLNNGYYTKTDVDNLLYAKANSSDVYSKAATDGMLSDKADLLADGRLLLSQFPPVVLDGIYYDASESPLGTTKGTYHTISNGKHQIVHYVWVNTGYSIQKVGVLRDCDPLAIYYNKDDETFYRYDAEDDDLVSIEIGGGTVTAVKMNNGTPIEPDSNGVVDLGTVLTSHQSLASVFGDVAYDSQTKRINFYGNGDTNHTTVLAYVDATNFIKDGMVSNVEIKNVTIDNVSTPCLVVSFNTDAGKNDINIPLSGIFNPSNYYTKTEVDAKGFLKKQRTVINMDDSDGVAFTDSSGDSLTHAQVIALLNDEDINVVLHYAVPYEVNSRQFTEDCYLLMTSKYVEEGETPVYYFECAKGASSGLFFEVALAVDDGEVIIDETMFALLAQEQIQADWNQSNTSAKDYIKNKPTIPAAVTIADNLTTNDASQALSAKQGKALNDGKVDKETGKGLSTNDYTTTEKNKLAGIEAGAEANVNADWDASSGDAQILNKPTIPSKVSDLTNDSAFITAQDAAGIVAGTADVVIVRSSEYIDIIFQFAEISVSPTAIALSHDNTSATLTVTGSHLKEGITAALSGTDAASFSVSGSPISQSGGSASGTLTVSYDGDLTDSSVSGKTATLTLTSGTTVKTVELGYSYAAGPTIIPASSAAISVKTGAGSEQSATLAVQGVNLEGDISAALSGTNADKFEIVSGATLDETDGSASGNVVVKYKPSANDSGSHTATLTLSSTNATSVQITLNGSVSTLSVKDGVSSLSLSTDQGASATATFKISGTNLREDVTVSASGNYFSIQESPATASPTNGTLAETTFTVVYNPSESGSHSGSVTISSSGVTKTITLNGTATEPITSDAEGKFTIKDVNNNTLYLKRKIVDGNKTTDVEVHQSNYNTAWNGAVANTYSGNVVIPATVVVDGVTCNITEIASNAFRYGSSAGQNGLSSLTLPEGITKIGSYFLYTSKSITSIVIPSTVTTIGSAFCYQASNLETIVMNCSKNANFQTTWGNANAPYCYQCTKLKSFVIPDKVTEIVTGTYPSFSGCSALTEITLGTDMLAFKNLFSQITNVNKIYCRGTTTIPKINKDSSTTWEIPSSVYQAAQVYVPTNYTSNYKSTKDGRQVSGNDVYPWNVFDGYNALQEYNPD